MDLFTPPETHETNRAQVELLKQGVTQNESQKSLHELMQTFGEKHKDLQVLLNEQKKLIPLFDQFDNRLETQEKTVNSLSSLLEEVTNTLHSSHEDFEKIKENLTQEILTLYQQIALLQKKNMSSSQEPSTFSQEISTLKNTIQLHAEDLNNLFETNNTNCTTYKLMQTKQENDAKTFSTKITFLERQSSIFKWIGGGMSLALLYLFMWIYTHNC